MAGRSILYLGGSEFAAVFCDKLKGLALCDQFTGSRSLDIPENAPETIDLVMFEAGPLIPQSGQTLTSLIDSLANWPLIAVSSREQEHRGMAAVRAGAQSCICVDDVDEAELEVVIEHAIQRHRLLARLSETDNTVLSILQSINDGVVVVDRHGHVLDINPAARSILALAPRQRTNARWARTFCRIAADGKTQIDHEELPLVKACRCHKFSDQTAVYQTPDQPDTILSINGQGL